MTWDATADGTWRTSDMSHHCKVKGCGAYFPTAAGLQQHMFAAQARHEQLAATNKEDRMAPEHKLFRHKSYLKQKRLRRNAAKAHMTPEEFVRAYPARSGGSGYKAGHGCGAGLHKWVAGASGKYMKCVKCKATRTLNRGTPGKANKAPPGRRKVEKL